MSILTRLRNLFKLGKLLSVDDSGNVRIGVAQYLGKEQPIVLMTPYGLMHNPPVNSIVCVADQLAQPSNGIGVADDPANRPFKNLLIGEVACANYAVGNYIKFCNSGVTEINGNDDNFVRWIPFNAAMQWFTTFFNAHTHNSPETPTPQMPSPWELEVLKTATVQTLKDGPYVPPT